MLTLEYVHTDWLASESKHICTHAIETVEKKRCKQEALLCLLKEEDFCSNGRGRSCHLNLQARGAWAATCSASAS